MVIEVDIDQLLDTQVDPLKVLPRLTEIQEKLLLFIVEYFFRHRDVPTHREMLGHLERKSTNARPYLQPLITKGYVESTEGKRRGLTLTPLAIEYLKRKGAFKEGQLTLPMQG